MTTRDTLYLAAFVITTGCASVAGGNGPLPATAASGKTMEARDTQEVQQAINNAKIAIDKTNQVGGLWRDTEEMLSSAEQAASKGDLTTAMKLANEARVQAELGYEQHLSQRNAKPPF
jgi:hypothetical protein